MALPLAQATALNLVLEGSVGSFGVGSGRTGQSSIEVKYFLTHIGLDFESGANAAALSHLEPVREIFDADTLEFDELMQRDIDDARVSSELIPYLLDPKSRDFVKLFPPIIIVVLPVEAGSNRPAALYPKVEEKDEKVEGQNYSLHITRSGALGQEVFQFEQPVESGKLFSHDLTRLKLNTHRSKLVIVDGQHRAMALLAIYRNLKQDWDRPRRAPFKDYYEEWTEGYISEFNLKQINVPVMFCTFPKLDETFQGDYDLKKAARAVFLTLNKTARKVSESRNRLLDDNDLVALFLRDTLSKIKERDARSPHALRISNVELDQMHDRIKIDTPLALTGVNNLYYMIEHLVFNLPDKDINGAKPRSGMFRARSDLGTYCANRLDALNTLGAEEADRTTRFSYAAEAGRKLTERFRSEFGDLIPKIFEEFLPFELHGQAALWLEQQLLAQGNPKLRPILFEGQGISRVFSEHRTSLKERYKEKRFGDEAPKIAEIIARLDATETLVQQAIQRFRQERAKRLLDRLSDKGKLRIDGDYSPRVVEYINSLFLNVFTTVAFQAAVIGTFVGEIERIQKQRKDAGKLPLDVPASFAEYMGKLNEFFAPTSSTGLRRLIEVFRGQPEGDLKDSKLIDTPHTFRQVVYRGEMQPDQWPKYRYLLLEIWRTEEQDLAHNIVEEREKCRDQIFNSFVAEYQKSFALDQSKRVDALSKEEMEKTFGDAFVAFKAFLRNLGWAASEIPTEGAMRTRISSKQEDAGESPPADDPTSSSPSP